MTPNPDGVDIVDPALQYKSYFRFASSASESDRELVGIDTPLFDKKIGLEEVGKDTWISLFHQLGLEGITRSIAANCLVGEAEGADIRLVLDASQNSVFNEEQQRRIKAAFDAYFGRDINLVIEPGSIDAETPAAWRERMDRERLQEAVQVFENDATVRAIVDRFSGAIKPGSIEPTKPKQY